MGAFDVAMGVLFSDGNIAESALFTPGVGQPATVRVITRKPDIFENVGESVIIASVLLLEVRVADCPAIVAGDQFTIGGVVYTVQAPPRRDSERLTWTVDVYAP